MDGVTSHTVTLINIARMIYDLDQRPRIFDMNGVKDSQDRTRKLKMD